MGAGTDLSRTDRAFARPGRAGVVVLALIVAAAACCSRGKGLPDRTPDARAIVAQRMESALDTFLDRSDEADRAAVKAFVDAIGDAATRADLVAAWNAVPALAALGPRFLDRQVFERAARDGDWPGGALDERAVHVMGVRAGAAGFLRAGDG